MTRHVVLLLGPSREVISGVTTHLNSLFGSRLATRFDLLHFQVGREGRREGLAGRLARFALSPLQLAGAIARHGVGLVHVNTSLNAKSFWRDAAYVAAAKLCGARVLYQVHGGAWDEFEAKAGLFAALMRRMLRWPDIVVVLSQEQLEAFRRAAPGQAIEKVPNGIDCAPYQRYNRAAPEARAPLRLIYVGRLVPGKGLLETIEGLRLARAQGVNARLVIAGNGPEEPRLRQYAREAGLTREVSFVGAAYGEHKAQLLAQADALALASYTEGLPYSLLEAMAAGVVPIVTPVGAIPDVVEDGEHGVIVAPRDAGAIAQAIATLAGDRAQLLRMSAACRKRVATAYSIERVARDFSQLYWALCASRAPRIAT
ncbi:MAG TPA: glycosyltransferase family 4 protein [Burkholderiales bacterium]|nr:glycosyltransferase family 4 protein [Burkholderiales bacterium]